MHLQEAFAVDGFMAFGAHSSHPSSVPGPAIVQHALIAQFTWSHGKANRGCKDFSVAANPICATHLKRVSKTQSP